MKSPIVLSLILTSFIYGQRQYDLIAPAPPAASAASATIVGAHGRRTVCYWVVANYPAGSMLPASPLVCVQDAPDTLSESNYVRLVWSQAQGAAGYDLLATATTAPPQQGCACAVSTGVTGVTANDTGARGAYTFGAAAGPAKISLRINNRDRAISTLELSGPANILGLTVRGAGPAMPANCTVGDLWFLTSGAIGLYQCVATDIWAATGSGGSSGFSGSYADLLNIPPNILNGPSIAQTGCYPIFAALNLLGCGAMTSDANNAVQFGQAFYAPNASTGSGTAVTLDWSDTNSQVLTLTGNVATLNFTNIADGQDLLLWIAQTGGGNTVAQPANVSGWPVIVTDAGISTVIKLHVIGTVAYVLPPVSIVGASGTVLYFQGTGGTGVSKVHADTTMGGDVTLKPGTYALVGDSLTQNLSGKTQTDGSRISDGQCYAKNFTASGSITQYTLVSIAGANVAPAATSAAIVQGIAQSTVTNGQTVSVCLMGTSNLLMDGTNTAGHIVVPSSTTAGDGTDSGQTSGNSIASTIALIGEVLTACTGVNCTAVVNLRAPGLAGRQTGSSGAICYQKGGSAVTMTGSAVTLGSACTVTSLAPGACVKFSFGAQHVGGNSLTYSITAFGTTTALGSGTPTTAMGVFTGSICNDPGVTNSQQLNVELSKFGTSTLASPNAIVTAVDATTPQTISFSATGNVADTAALKWIKVAYE
jgi:hypothetical protein